jgi:mRNA interferase MazF
MRRGEIWWAALDIPSGSEPGYRRPVVIVSNNLFNQGGLRTVLTVPVTSNMARETVRGNVRLPSGRTGLPRDSVAVAIQVASTDKRYLLDRIGRVPDDIMSKINDALRLALAL